MTLNDLRNEVAALAFEDSISLNKSFVASANRALITLFTERPVAKTVRIPTAEQKPLSYIPTLTHIGGEDITVKLIGRAYIFRVCGRGTFTLSDGISVKTKSFDSENALFRGTIRTGEASITFSGDFIYTVYALTCYGELYSENESDIREYTPKSEYDLNALFGDFLAFLEAPRTRDSAVYDAIMQNGTLILPFGKYDEVYLTYARMPRLISADYPDAAIDISGECQPLLALLTASYLWLDDDAEKAQYYMSIYRTQMSFIRRYNTSISANGYQDVTGWA